MRRSQRGMSLVELVVGSTIFMVVLVIVFLLMREMGGHEKRLPINLMTHPQTDAVLSRLRKDVQSATSPYYPASYEGQEQTKKVLILYSLEPSGYAKTIVWDFSKEGEVHRRSYSAGRLSSDWMARGTPSFIIDTFEIPNRPYSVRVMASDATGKLAIDQIFQPRAYDMAGDPPRDEDDAEGEETGTTDTTGTTAPAPPIEPTDTGGGTPPPGETTGGGDAPPQTGT